MILEIEYEDSWYYSSLKGGKVYYIRFHMLLTDLLAVSKSIDCFSDEDRYWLLHRMLNSKDKTLAVQNLQSNDWLIKDVSTLLVKHPENIRKAK